MKGEKAWAHILALPDRDTTNACNWLHSELQHGFATLLLTPALL